MDLAAKKKELLRQMMARKGIAVPKQTVGITRRKDLDTYPLSSAQRRLWFLHRLEPNSPFYNMPAVLRLQGVPDVLVLRRVLAQLVLRHESLRTVFVDAGAGPEARLLPPNAVQMEHHHLSDQTEKAVQDHVDAFTLQPFDLSTGPLLRMQLLTLQADQHLLLLNQHHIISDGWSLNVLVAELTALYTGYVQGQKDAFLPEPKLQYADFASWNQSKERQEVHAKQLAWWQQQLAGMPEQHALPLDFPRPAQQTFAGALERLRLDAPSAARLEALAAEAGATVSSALLALFATLLGRLSGTSDVVVGMPIANRNRPELEGLIGFFVNTLVMRLQLEDDGVALPFRQLLNQTHRRSGEAAANQDVPFEQLVEALNPIRDPSLAPLFQIAFVMQQDTPQPPVLPGLSVSFESTTHQIAKYDLTLIISKQGHGYSGDLEYNTALFQPATIRRMADAFQRLAEAVCHDPNRAVDRLNLLDEAQRKTLTTVWNRTAPPYPFQPLHVTFEALAQQQPEHPALADGTRQWTYGQLNSQANRLAHQLRAEGAEGRIVAVCLPHGGDIAVALLAVLKAGAAYLPLDPSTPEARLTYMLEDAQPVLIITQNTFPNFTCIPFEALDTFPTTNPQALVHEAQPAYIIYTSGSTGRPKGTVITHRGIANSIASDTQGFELGQGSRVLHAASFSFDAATSHLFMALCSGAAVRIVDPLVMTAKNGSDLLREHRITHFTTPISTLAAMKPIHTPDLRHLAAGGDFFPQKVVADWHAPGRRVVNIYGPTEATITTTIHVCSTEERKPPIGAPIAGLSIYVLDHLLAPVPIGAPGVLYIGGVGLAQGYLHRAGLTAARFIPNPFARDLSDTRLYHTGDLVRFLVNGECEFLGRADQQVKWRGYRIEPEEIAAVLERCPEVMEARVLVRPGAETLLVAYVRTQDGLAGDATTEANLRRTLQDHLQQGLPAYMRPQRLLFLDRLPQTVNGKVDDKALLAMPLPDQVARVAKPLTTSNEHLIAELFQETLDLSRKPGADADFFELGGHSLPAAGIPARLRQSLGIELPLRVIFDNPTVAQLAGVLDQYQTQDTLPPITPVPHQGVLSFAQQRLLFLHNLDPEGAAYNIVTGLHLDGVLDSRALEQAFTHILARHDALRTTFQEMDGQAIAVVAPANPFHLESQEVTPEALAEAVEAERIRPFDLKHGPVFRARLLRTGAEHHFILASMHHIVADGWSAGVIVEELTALYTALVAGKPVDTALPPLTVQYGDYAVWQRDHYQTVQQQHKAWWLQKLAGAPTVLPLPLDYPRQGAGNRADALHFSLTPVQTQGLNQLARQQSATLFMILSAALGVLLSRATGRRDLLLGAPNANRGQAELEPMIGFFLNLVPLRLQLVEDMPFRDLLDQVRETALASFAHQDLPFEVLVEELAPDRHLDRAPLCQVLFVLQSMPKKKLQLPGLTVRNTLIEETDVKVDLNLTMTETDSGMSGVWRYNAGIFDPRTIDRFNRWFGQVIDAVLADADQKTDDLLCGAEPETPLPPATHELLPVHTQVEAVARTQPEAIALDLDSGPVTYRRMNEEANRFAHALIAAGVMPGDRVAVLTEEEPRAVISLLGILKAGGVFLCPPNDPRLPNMLAEADPKVLIVWPSARDEAPPFTGTILYPETALSGQSDINPDLPVGAPQQPVYMTFTSGSTGTPKAILQSSGSWRQFVAWFAGAFQITTQSRVANLTRHPFDSCYYESFSALTRGAVLCPGTQQVKTDPLFAAGWLSSKRIHVAKCVPGFLRGMMAAFAGQAPISLTHMLTAGEAMPVDLARDWYRLAPQVPLFNLYGPSEAILTSVHKVRIEDVTRSAIPLGRAIPGRRLVLMDDRGRPCPEGVPGEIVIHSGYLTLGYWNRPEETTQRFGQAGNVRTYRTGDLGMINSDGTLRFLGRIDNQVKIRGVRVELEEIERLLEQHTDVIEAAVALQAAGTSDAFIVAYVIFKGDEAASIQALTAFIDTHLPRHMRPAGIRAMAKLPRTASGKRDRKALPPVSLEELTGATVRIAPRSPDEHAVAAIWSHILKREDLSVKDNFFHLGGHSLMAGRVLARIQSDLQVGLTLKEFFQEPTIEGIANRMAVLRRTGGNDLPALTPRPDKQARPLSFSQQRLWFLDRLSEDKNASAAYNLKVALQLDGELDLATLNWSLDQVIQRHEALRTDFPTIDDNSPYQRVLPAEPVNLIAEPIEASQRCSLLQQITAEPFQLTGGKLLRIRLLQINPTRHILIMVMHHIISDGWSGGIFVQELSLLYGRRGMGEVTALQALPPLPVQYTDFAWWQHNHLAGEPLERQKAYWLDKLEGAPTLHGLVTDQPRPSEMRFEGASLSFELDQACTQALMQLGRDRGATLFMVLQAAFALLLARYSGEDDIMLGSPIANRTRKEVEPLIGFFVNTLVLRTHVPTGISFITLLDQVCETSLEAFANQDVPFEQLVDALNVPRNMAHAPLFQIIFVLQNAELPELELPGLHVKALEMEQQTAKFDLGLSLTERNHGLFGHMEYNTSLFTEATIQRLVAHYTNLLHAVAADPHGQCDRIPLTSADEKAHLLDHFSRNEIPYDLQTPIHRLFEKCVVAHPQADALVNRGVTWNYDRLNREANQLAHRLRSEGLRPEDIVGFCLPRCPELVMTMLAVLKAGGAYMPLDPAYPRERLDYMLQDSGLKYLVTFEPTQDVPEGVINISLNDQNQAYPETNLNLVTSPANAAFIIYTSGSTGKPKGTVLIHEALTNTILSDIDGYATGPGERFMQIVSFSFDAGTSHTFMTLCAGGALHIHDTDDILDPVRFEEVMTSERITMTIVSPSALSALPKLTLPHLRLIAVGGEALPDDVKETWAPEVTLVNVYGPTEGTISTSRERCRSGRKTTIGRPIPNQEVFILDTHFNPAPIGVPGELMIGGRGLTRCYLRQPALTAQRFRPHPFSKQPGTRLYHSGDRARFLEDGRIDFLGRLDNQIKLRGFRIETGEIEAVLRSEADLTDAAVLLRPRPNSNDMMLVAYLHCHHELDTQALAERLRTRLPTFMVPSVFVPLERLPLTPNGKLDIDRLPTDVGLCQKQEHVAPRDDTEQALAHIFAETLGLPDGEGPGVFDNFFHLGGHSLLAVQVIARIRRRFEVEPSLRLLFTDPTIAGLATWLRGVANADEDWTEGPDEDEEELEF